MAIKRFVPLVLCVTLLVSGCGGGDEVSLTEFVERLNPIMVRASQQYEELVASPQGAVLVAEGAQLADFTPQDLQAALERLGEIEAEALEAGAGIEPPSRSPTLPTSCLMTDSPRRGWRLPLGRAAPRTGRSSPRLPRWPPTGLHSRETSRRASTSRPNWMPPQSVVSSKMFHGSQVS